MKREIKAKNSVPFQVILVEKFVYAGYQNNKND